MRYWVPAVSACLLIAAAPVRAQSPVGEWRVADGSAYIRLVDCDSVLWGVVSWEETPGRDTKNPNAALRDGPTLGIPVLLHMTRSGEHDRWNGKVYNADNGKTYTASIQLRGPDTLHVQGCTMGILCGGQDWTRLSDDGDTTRLGVPGSPARVSATDICAQVRAAAGQPTRGRR